MTDPSGRWHGKVSPCLPEGTCPRNWRSGREASKVTPQRSPKVTPQRDQTRHSQGAKPRGKSRSDGGSRTFSLELWMASGLQPGEGDASVRLEPKNTSEESGQQRDPTDQKLHFLLILQRSSCGCEIPLHLVLTASVVVSSRAELPSPWDSSRAHRHNLASLSGTAPLSPSLHGRGGGFSFASRVYVGQRASSFKEGWSCFIKPASSLSFLFACASWLDLRCPSEV